MADGPAVLLLLPPPWLQHATYSMCSDADKLLQALLPHAVHRTCSCAASAASCNRSCAASSASSSRSERSAATARSAWWRERLGWPSARAAASLSSSKAL